VEDLAGDVQVGVAAETFATSSEEDVADLAGAMALVVQELVFLVRAVAKCKREASGRASGKASGTCGHPYTALVAALDRVAGGRHTEAEGAMKDENRVEALDREDEASCR
jgi:hypothetical protein